MVELVLRMDHPDYLDGYKKYTYLQRYKRRQPMSCNFKYKEDTDKQ